MSAAVKKAVIVAAGAGTRFLPITKAIPKEMLPLLSRPLIQYIVEEITASGISEVVFVIAKGKEVIADYFLPAPELEALLEARGDLTRLEEIKVLPQMARFSRVYQSAPLGLGHAIAAARSSVGDEPFAVVLPDDIIDSTTPALQQMLDVYRRHPGSILLVEKCGADEVHRYGVIEGETIGRGIYRVSGLVEKPKAEEAPSNLAVIGRYILEPDVFGAIAATPPGHGGEIQLTDALRLLLKTRPVYACELEGTRYDTGEPGGWLQANNTWESKRGTR
ncbi:UTP--glucose-1-phosphate uridylyltransferase [Dehalogenimonas alkenigignens]|nr:UTP--glucose-1-phosphate uridylyltransferase [Dehalogenimonas alkenigignens]